LNRVLQPSVATVVIGARNEEQVRQNIVAFGLAIYRGPVAQLDVASAVTPACPY
jgi:aryl-alcohol dehydrogenase-like predicted oxidoreductase